MEVDMNTISRELRQYRKENDFYETDLRQWNEDLGKLATQFDNLSNIVLQRNSAMLINSISVVVTSNSAGSVDSSKVSNIVPNNNPVGVKRTESQMNIDTRICYFCGKAGHISRYCFKRRRFEHENGNCHPNCALCRRHGCADLDSVIKSYSTYRINLICKWIRPEQVISLIKIEYESLCRILPNWIKLKHLQAVYLNKSDSVIKSYSTYRINLICKWIRPEQVISLIKIEYESLCRILPNWIKLKHLQAVYLNKSGGKEVDISDREDAGARHTDVYPLLHQFCDEIFLQLKSLYNDIDIDGFSQITSSKVEFFFASI
ncbi:unnamed protein product [Adineta ricciae]|uniref:CCHC-type domain-containing protein n=1 Tax=Adineta ricciae TaxID=249248 RepID=A0A815B5Y8_ADIRI|nr:unnamed protein product [Adineta ricciae]